MDRFNDRRDHRGNPQIYYYLKKYQDDPSSRVFAPLAEAYRKAGLVDEAIEIARDGVRLHPHFVGGKVALARALFDRSLYEEVIKELESVVRDVPDNLIAQRLLAESYLILGKTALALNAYKVLLFFMPQDAELAGLVTELETKAYESGDISLEEKIDIVRIQGSEKLSQTAWIWKIEVLQAALVRLTQLKSERAEQ